MAREMKHHSWDDYGKKRIKTQVNYPWHRWLNGSMWFLVKGEDFEGDIRTFQRYIHAYARNHGIRVKTKRNEANTGLFIKAYASTTKDGLRRQRHFRAVERRFLELHYDDEHSDEDFEDG